MRSDSSRLRILLHPAVGVLTCGLLLLSAVFMHTLMATMGEPNTMSATSMVQTSLTNRVEGATVSPMPTAEAVAATPLVQPLTGQDGDCGGLCGVMCSLMGMACVMLLVVLTVVLLRGSGRRLLFVVSRQYSAGVFHARDVAPRRPKPLTTLSILRI